jgi:hypothetical protein
MRENSAQLPTLMDAPSMSVRSASWRGMAGSYAEVGAGTDLGPALRGLPGVDAIVEHLLATRERYGISHVWTYPHDTDALAPVVVRLAGT